MIKINKQDCPSVLKDNKEMWTKSLLDAVAQYGGYSKIPNDIKTNLLSYYRHEDIQKALFESSFSKCAFCECNPTAGGYIEIEHFAPKSLYPELTFDWDNLLPSCKRCNIPKDNLDTITEPIINPSKIDPETVFTYDLLTITAIKGTPQEEVANRTHKVCDLNSPRLYEARANLLKQLTEYRDELEKHIVLIEEADTPLKKTRRISTLRNSLDKFEYVMKADKCYAGYCRWFVANNPVYAKAKTYINE